MPQPLSTSVQRNVFEWRSAAWPVRWRDVFARDAPLVLEIGFGNGQFLVDQAVARPDRDHIGIELSWSGATRLFKRVRKANVENARALLINADVALRELFTTESLHEVFVNHPCPWPKARHIGRRLLQPEGLALLVDRMVPGARLTVVTDHAEYAEWLSDVLSSQDALASCHASIEVDSIPGRSPTKYQLKAMAQGIPIHYFEWKRERAPSGAFDGLFASPPATSPMLSITLRGSLEPSDLFREFTPQVLRETHDGVEVVVRLIAVYRRENSRDASAWMVEVLVQEDGLRQEFAVMTTERRDGRVLIKLSGLGRPHPTHGVKRAIFGIAAWLRERHPELEVEHENVGEAAMSPLDAEASDTAEAADE